MTGFGLDGERVRAYVCGLGVFAAVAAPSFLAPRADSYPLSTYPMFARPKFKTSVAFVEGADAEGRAVRLRPEVVANDEAMQAAQSVRRAIRGGDARMALLCGRVAQRVQERPEYAGVVNVRIVEGLFDSIGYFLGASEPEARTAHFECSVQPKARP